MYRKIHIQKMARKTSKNKVSTSSNIVIMMKIAHKVIKDWLGNNRLGYIVTATVPVWQEALLPTRSLSLRLHQPPVPRWLPDFCAFLSSTLLVLHFFLDTFLNEMLDTFYSLSLNMWLRFWCPFSFQASSWEFSAWFSSSSPVSLSVASQSQWPWSTLITLAFSFIFYQRLPGCRWNSHTAWTCSYSDSVALVVT